LWGASKFLLPINTPSTMPSSQNIDTRTVTPTVVNPETVPVDSNPEEDLEEIQHEASGRAGPD